MVDLAKRRVFFIDIFRTLTFSFPLLQPASVSIVVVLYHKHMRNHCTVKCFWKIQTLNTKRLDDCYTIKPHWRFLRLSSCPPWRSSCPPSSPPPCSSWPSWMWRRACWLGKSSPTVMRSHISIKYIKNLISQNWEPEHGRLLYTIICFILQYLLPSIIVGIVYTRHEITKNGYSLKSISDNGTLHFYERNQNGPRWRCLHYKIWLYVSLFKTDYCGVRIKVGPHIDHFWRKKLQYFEIWWSNCNFCSPHKYLIEYEQEWNYLPVRR